MSGRLTRLILVRHGRTSWNEAGRLLGAIDEPLDPVGRMQAAAVAERLAREAVTTVVTSPLLRASATAAEIAAHHGLMPSHDPRLAEIDLGQWQGLVRHEIPDGHPYQRWREDPDTAPPAPDGETFAAFAARVSAALGDALNAHAGGTVVLVSHAGPIRAAVVAALQSPASAFYRLVVDHCSLTEIQVVPEGRFLVRFNDRYHEPGQTG